MKNLIITLTLFLSAAATLSAQDSFGMKVDTSSWNEIMQKAKAQQKLVFVDFYTQWCGPCFNMAENVFTLPNIGAFYNDHFVCTKVDCENGEGIALKKKYGIKLYPTYLFIDPATEEPVHYSKSAQPAEQFLFTGQSALIPERRSTYLEKEFAAGNRSLGMLSNYILYHTSIFQTDKARTAFDMLIEDGKTLADSAVWSLFVKAIQSIDNPYIIEVSDNYADYVRRYGKKAVDEKLAKETTYGDLTVISKLCDFDGKAFNIELIHATKAIQNKNYEDATSRIDALIADSLNTDRQKLVDRLKFLARYMGYEKQLPEKYYLKYVEYLRFVAYNDANRTDPYIHHDYAEALEQIIKRSKGNTAPEQLIAKPPHAGRKDYSMRPDALKQKPEK